MKIKKLLLAIVGTLLLLSSFNSVSALQDDNAGESDDYERVSYEYQLQIQEYLMRKNSGIQPRYSQYSLAITRLAQSDSRWKDVKLGNCATLTIGSSGCALTAVTMVYNYYNDPDITPVEMNTKLMNATNGYCEMNWEAAAKAINSNFKTEIENITSISDLYDIVAANLFYERPVIVKLANSSGSTHFVVVWQYYESGSVKKIYIRDPGGYNRATLDEFLNAGWSLSRYYVFK